MGCGLALPWRLPFNWPRTDAPQGLTGKKRGISVPSWVAHTGVSRQSCRLVMMHPS